MSENDGDRQLDLLGAVSSERATRGGENLAVRWVEVDALGRVGRAAWPGRGGTMREDVAHLREHHRASVLLAVVDDAAALIEVAAEVEVDVRQLAPGDRGERLAQHASGLAADLRGGRRVVVVGEDPSAVALPIACALSLLGKREAEAIDALDGALADPERAALRAFIESSSPAQPARDDATAQALPSRRDDEAASDATIKSTLPSRRDGEAASDAPKTSTLPSRRDGESASDGPMSSARGPSRRDGESASDAPKTGDEARLDLDEMFDRVEPAHDLDALARSPRAARLLGAVLGGAIGDAMGHPTEFIRSFEAIRERFGPQGVTGYELTWKRDGARIAPYTDDTQMAECVLRALLWGREQSADLDATMGDMASRFVEWSKNPQGGHRAPGNACLAGCRNLERGVPWSEAGGATAGGCGSVMRAYPFGLVFANDLARAEAWAVAHSKLTHRDPIALAASAAMAVGVARILRDESVPVVLSEMVAAACRYSPKTAAMMARAIDEAQEGVGPETTLERLEGWAAHEAIAAAIYVFARHPDDPRAAILEGANTPGDSDSIATLAGALVGARVGVGAFPSDWIRELERADALIDLALAI